MISFFFFFLRKVSSESVWRRNRNSFRSLGLFSFIMLFFYFFKYFVFYDFE